MSNLEPEVFEIIKGDCKSIIKCTFTERGSIESISYDSLPNNDCDCSISILQKLLYMALQNEDYKSAYLFQQDINECKRKLKEW